MSEEALKKLEEIQKTQLKQGEDLNEIKEFISKRDVVTNPEYCNLKKKNGKPMPMPTLIGWFKKGCPREDSRHVSIKAVDEWARTRNTRKAK